MTNPPAGGDHVFTTPAVLRNGTAVTIRVMRPDDRDRLIAAFAKLEQSSIYTRFFSYRKEIPESALARIAAIDFVNTAGLVATIGSGGSETVIGGASYIGGVADDGERFAEVAFTIEEDYQGQGLASRLFAALATLARRHGIARFTADVLAGNAAMLAVFERSGLSMRRRRDGGVLHVEIDLDMPAA